MTRRKSIGRSVHLTRKSKAKPYKQQPSALLNRVEELSDVDGKVRKEIKERRAEERKRSKKESE